MNYFLKMPFGKKKSYQLTGKSEKKNSASVGKYTKKTEKKYNTIIKPIVKNSTTCLLSKYKIPKEVKKSKKLQKILKI